MDWPEFRLLLLRQIKNSRSTSGSSSANYPRDMLSAIDLDPIVSTSLGGSYHRVRNPHLGFRDLVEHKLTDVRGDVSRRMQIQSRVMKATMPIKAAAIFLFGPLAASIGGFVLDQAITQSIASPLSTLDKVTDAYDIVTDQVINDKSIYGYSWIDD